MRILCQNCLFQKRTVSLIRKVHKRFIHNEAYLSFFCPRCQQQHIFFRYIIAGRIIGIDQQQCFNIFICIVVHQILCRIRIVFIRWQKSNDILCIFAIRIFFKCRLYHTYFPRQLLHKRLDQFACPVSDNHLILM